MTTHTQTKTQVLSATTLIGDTVRNPQGEELGTLEEIMFELDSGRIAYAVLSFGGFLGLGDKLFAIPWQALSVDTEDEEVVLNVSKEQLEDAPGFDKDDWPSTFDRNWVAEVHTYYGYQPYWM
ncbi:MAG: PRC-barrel domain-containing protein [Anaerolineales bacterium]|nr:PRC-barrel domain-containing protein [Anaerolineales bacterium]